MKRKGKIMLFANSCFHVGFTNLRLDVLEHLVIRRDAPYFMLLILPNHRPVNHANVTIDSPLGCSMSQFDDRKRQCSIDTFESFRKARNHGQDARNDSWTLRWNSQAKPANRSMFPRITSQDGKHNFRLKGKHNISHLRSCETQNALNQGT